MIRLDANGRPMLTFHRYQQMVMTSTKRIVIMLAGTQGGKTVTGAPWLYNEIARRGSGDYLAVTTNFGLFKLKMLPALQEFFEDILGIGRLWSGLGVIEIAHPTEGFWAKKQTDRMWARIILRSVASPSGLESATAKAAWLDEFGMPEWDVTHWEAIKRRLSMYRGRVLGTTTPYNEGWVKTLLFEKWLNGDPDIEIIQFASIENPGFSEEEFEDARRNMPEWRFKMFYLGQFAKPPHLVYQLPDDFYVPRFPIAGWWRVLVGVDFGGVNTARIALAQHPETGVWYVFDEWLGGNMSTPEHTAQAREDYALWWQGGNVRAVGGAPSESQERRDWEAAGFPVEEPPASGVETRIEAVRRLINEGRLKVFGDLAGLRHEFATYRRETLSDGTIIDRIKDKNRFHRLDALGYAAVAIVHGEEGGGGGVI